MTKRYGVGSLEEEIRRMSEAHAGGTQEIIEPEGGLINEEVLTEEEETVMLESLARDVEAFVKAGNRIIDQNRKAVLNDPKRQKVFDRKFGMLRKAIEKAQNSASKFDLDFEMDGV